MSVPPDPNHDEAPRRLRGAFDTLESARHQLTRGDLAAGIACLLAHLAAEKAFKALLVALHQPFKKTHDLVELRRLTVTSGPSIEVAEEDLARLNPWSIDGRYAEDVPEASSARAGELVGLAASVLEAIEESIEQAAEGVDRADQLLGDDEGHEQ